MRDFYLELDVKVDSFIPLLSSITPQDTIKITKIGSSLMIDYTLVGYEYLSCKRRYEITFSVLIKLHYLMLKI